MLQMRRFFLSVFRTVSWLLHGWGGLTIFSLNLSLFTEEGIKEKHFYFDQFHIFPPF